MPTIGCRNCGGNGAGRPRGLCWTCYYKPDIRQRFMMLDNERGGKRSECPPDFNGTAPDPTPTAALPGSEEKMRVLEERALRGEALFHPDDPTNRDGPRGMGLPEFFRVANGSW